MNIKTIFRGFAGIAIVMLVGCGGDSGSSSDVNPTPSPDVDPAPTSGVDNVTLGGAAVKGIIKLGNVVAEELRADGTVLAQVGNATTGSDGSYSIAVSNAYSGGPIKVTVSADADTQMKCDVVGGCGARVDGLVDITNPVTVDFGEWYKPVTLNMMALVAEAAANDTVKVNITPYTNLAADYALNIRSAMNSSSLNAGSLTPGRIYNANSEVSDLLGLNILDTQPVDITDIATVNDGEATEIVYAAVSAAVLTDSNTVGEVPDVNGALSLLSNSFSFDSGGSIVADDSGSATGSNTLSLQEIIDGALAVLDEMGIADVSDILAELQADVGEVPGGNVDPTPGDTADDTPLAKVKAFVGDIRTWGSVIESEAGVNNGGAFDIQAGLMTTAADLSMDFLFGPAFFASAEVMEMHFHGRNTSPNLTDYATGLPTDPQFTEGTIAKSDGVITITEGVIDGVTVNMSMKLPVDGEVLLTASSFVIEIISARFESAATDAYLHSGKVAFNLTSEYVVDWTAVDLGNAVMPGILGGTVDLDMSMTQKQDELGEPLAAEITFAGTLSSRFVNPAVISGAADDISGIVPATLTMSGDVGDTVGNKFSARFTFNVPNLEILAALGLLNTATAKIGLGFTMQLAGVPDVSVNISGTNTDFINSDGTRTGVKKGTATTTISYGARRIVIKSDLGGAVDNVAAIIGEATITNQDGVTMSFDGNLETLEGDVVFNGTSYAAISVMNNGAVKITYSDESFEIL